MSRTARLEERLGHRFRHGELLEQALTHRSFGTPHNERLEFLGDGVLGCVIAEALLARFPQLSEGELSRMRASLVRQEALAAAAASLELAGYLRMGQGESARGGAQRPSILADALEALFGAVFLDGGYASARAAVLATLGGALAATDELTTAKDPKTRLQEVPGATLLAAGEIDHVQSRAYTERDGLLARIDHAESRLTGHGGHTREREAIG